MEDVYINVIILIDINCLNVTSYFTVFFAYKFRVSFWLCLLGTRFNTEFHCHFHVDYRMSVMQVLILQKLGKKAPFSYCTFQFLSLLWIYILQWLCTKKLINCLLTMWNSMIVNVCIYGFIIDIFVMICCCINFVSLKWWLICILFWHF